MRRWRIQKQGVRPVFDQAPDRARSDCTRVARDERFGRENEQDHPGESQAHVSSQLLSLPCRPSKLQASAGRIHVSWVLPLLNTITMDWHSTIY